MSADPIRVLHVEADPAAADLVSTHLEGAEDMEVVVAESGRAGLDRIAEGGIDCAVVVHDPPAVDCIEFVERLEERDAGVPVVVFGDPAEDPAADAALDAGAAGYVGRGDTMALARLADRVRQAASDYRVAADRPDYERIVEGLPEPVYVLDGDGRFVAVNEAFLDLTGYDRASVLGSDASLIKTPEMRVRSGTVMETIRRADGPEDVRYEIEIRTADGRRVRCTDSVGVLPFEDGRPDGFVGVLRDVSDRDRRERVLATLHETTRDLMVADSASAVAEHVLEAADAVLGLGHVGIHRHDEEAGALVPVTWTEEVETTIGEPPALGPDSLAWEAFRTGETRRYEDLRETGGLANPETPLRSELIVPLDDRGVAIFASTEPGAFTREDESLARVLCANATAALERTEREAVLRRRERELERENERLERLTNFLSHDLRNPLEVAKGRTELARAERDGEHLEKVAAALDRMETLVSEFLTMAREGRTVDRTEPVGLADAAREAWETVETDGAALRTEAGTTVRADPGRLTRLFENLFRNSVEHGSTDSRTEAGD
ncbi:MAG: PAS domain S-box protein, partial [Haloferacaceae archaeon]